MTNPEEHQVPLLSRLKPAPGAVKSRKRKGRGPGSGTGKTAGKGMKGQKARHPGNFSKLAFEGGQMPLQRRLPKIGFWNPFSRPYSVVNVSDLGRFQTGTEIGPEELKASRLVRSNAPRIKVLAKGEIDRPLTVRVHAVSKSAESKIVKAGGKVELIENKGG